MVLTFDGATNCDCFYELRARFVVPVLLEQPGAILCSIRVLVSRQARFRLAIL